MTKLLIIGGFNRDTKVLLNALEGAHYTVRHFLDGAGACSYLTHARVDCCLVELKLVDMEAATFIQNLRRLSEGKLPPVILTGNLEESGLAGKLLPLGVQAFLPHPYDTTEAVNLVASLLVRSDPANESGEILFEVERGLLILRLPKRLEHANSSSFLLLLEGGICKTADGVIVDASRVEYICSTAIGSLHLLAHHFTSTQNKLFLCGASARISHMLEIAGIFSYFKRAEAVEEAVALLS